MRVGKQLHHHLVTWCNVNKTNLIAFLVIIATVIAGNGLYVFGWRDANPALQLSGIAVESSGKVLEGTNTIDPNNGITSQALGNAAAQDILAGNMPLWNHYEGIGSPLLGEMQSAALSPLTLLLRFDAGLLLAHMILELIAGFFTYLFLRKLQISAIPATIGGVLFALNGTFAWITNAAFNPIAFLPVLFYSVEQIITASQKVRSRGWILFAVALALSLYAGFPETAFIDMLLVALWAVVRMVGIKGWEDRIRSLRKFAMGGIIGLALAAPVLVAFLGYLPDANVGAHGSAFVHAHLQTISMPAQVIPYVYGTIFSLSSYDTSGMLQGHWGSVGGYIPVTLFFLCIIGLFAPISRTVKAVFGVWIVACILKMFGFGPAEFFWNLVPTIKNAAFYRYVTPSIYFAATVLGAYGLQALFDKKISRKRFALATLVTLGVLGVLVFIARHEVWRISSAPHYKWYAVASVVWAFGVVLSIVFTRIFIRKKYQVLFLSTIIATDLLVMFIIPQLSTPKVTINEAPVQFLQQNLGNNRYYTLGPIAPNYGSYYKIASINQNDLPVPKAWSEYLTKNLDTNTDPILFIGLFRSNQSGTSAFDEFTRNQANFRYVGVKYLVTAHNQLTNEQVSNASLHKVFESVGVDIYELSDIEAYFDPSDQCVVTKIVSRDELKAKCSIQGSLVRKELSLPGWKANVNGSTMSVKTEQGIFQKIGLPKGESTVKYTYLPPYMGVAYVAWGIAVLSVVWVYIVPERYQMVARSWIVDRLGNTIAWRRLGNQQHKKGKKKV